MTDGERRKAERRKSSSPGYNRPVVFWRGVPGSEGEAAAAGGMVILSDDHGTVLTYSREAWEAMVDGYDRLRDREARESP